jgi:3-hydroxyisobutyrate dehydrogenase-like beta-hydroxyacid dehydrogenase
LPEEESSLMRVGFIGAGRMGAPMVRRLGAAGHHVHALGRTDEKRKAILKLNAHSVGDVVETAERAEAVIICVFTDEQVQQICFETELLDAMAPGSALILHTTCSPRTAEAIVPVAPHVNVIDAPVSGGPQEIEAGHLTVFVGGADDAVKRVTPLLSAYGDPILHAGPTGAGQKVKLINNALFAAQIGLLREAVALGDRLGLAESTLLAALPSGSGSSRVAGHVAAGGSVGGFIDSVGEFVGKDVAVIREIVRQLGSDLGLLDDVINAGLPDDPEK